MSSWNSALLSTALVVAAGLAVLMISARALPRPERDIVFRRTAWIVIGFVGLPAAFFSTIELVGPFYILGLVVITALLARWRRFDHVIAIFASLLLALLIIGSAVASVTGGRTEGSLAFVLTLAVSGLAMTVSAAKLGRILGQRTFYRSAFGISLV